MTRWLLGQFLCNFCMHKQPFSPLPPWFFSILKTWGSFYVFFPLPVITLLCFLSSSSHVYSSMFSFLFPCILLCLLVTIFLYLYLLFFFYHNFLVNFSPSLKTHLNPKPYLKKKKRKKRNEASCTLFKRVHVLSCLVMYAYIHVAFVGSTGADNFMSFPLKKLI